mmetsp:Transcript_37490/g.87785  ORF Transcript_37490/g.87785 Transcript_37490/m.87785 type:complete len:259 (+) Transcript_37490:451-1227(+)
MDPIVGILREARKPSRARLPAVCRIGIGARGTLGTALLASVDMFSKWKTGESSESQVVKYALCCFSAGMSSGSIHAWTTIGFMQTSPAKSKAETMCSGSNLSSLLTGCEEWNWSTPPFFLSLTSSTLTMHSSALSSSASKILRRYFVCMPYDLETLSSTNCSRSSGRRLNELARPSSSSSTSRSTAASGDSPRFSFVAGKSQITCVFPLCSVKSILPMLTKTFPLHEILRQAISTTRKSFPWSSSVRMHLPSSISSLK